MNPIQAAQDAKAQRDAVRAAIVHELLTSDYATPEIIALLRADSKATAALTSAMSSLERF